MYSLSLLAYIVEYGFILQILTDQKIPLLQKNDA